MLSLLWKRRSTLPDALGTEDEPPSSANFPVVRGVQDVTSLRVEHSLFERVGCRERDLGCTSGQRRHLPWFCAS